VTPFEWDVRVSSKEDPGGHADVYWPGSLHHSTGHYSTVLSLLVADPRKRGVVHHAARRRLEREGVAFGADGMPLGD